MNRTNTDMIFRTLGATVIFAAALSCGSDTGRARKTFEVEITGKVTSPTTNEEGFTLEIDEAWMSLGEIRFYEGEPLFAQANLSWGERLARLVLPVAHAHPGHYDEGAALAEALAGGVADLTSERVTALGTADGVTGDYLSAEIKLTPSTEIEGHSVLARGMVSKDGVSRPFEAYLDLDELVEGIAFGETLSEARAGKVQITVDVDAWLNRADFSEALTSSTTQTLVLMEGSQPHNAFSRGVDNTSAFLFEWIDQ